MVVWANIHRSHFGSRHVALRQRSSPTEMLIDSTASSPTDPGSPLPAAPRSRIGPLRDRRPRPNTRRSRSRSRRSRSRSRSVGLHSRRPCSCSGESEAEAHARTEARWRRMKPDCDDEILGARRRQEKWERITRFINSKCQGEKTTHPYP